VRLRTVSSDGRQGPGEKEDTFARSMGGHHALAKPDVVSIGQPLHRICVTYPPKPWGKTMIYGDTSMNIDVASSR